VSRLQLQRQALDAALHAERLGSMLAGVLDTDREPAEARLQVMGTWIAELNKEAAFLRVALKGLRWQDRLRKAGQA